MFYEFEKKIIKSSWSMSDMHCHNHYELYILLEGDRSLFIENSLFNIRPVSVFFCPPFVMHKTEGEAFKRININFSDDYFTEAENKVFTKFLAKKIINVPSEDICKVNLILEKIEKYFNNSTEENEVFVRCLTYELLHLLCGYTSNNDNLMFTPGVLQPTVLVKIQDYIDNHLNEELNLDFLANKFFISRSYLCKLFKKYIGVSVAQSILSRRLAKACMLLAEGKISVSKISELCGFSSANYFGLIFKKNIGLSPINYRKYQKEKRG